MRTVFLRAIEATDKAADLLESLHEPEVVLGRRRFEVEPARFRSIPRSPFAYWASDKMRNLFTSLEAFESSGRAARVGVATLDNFRFLRLHWEVRPPFDKQGWCPYAKGGAYSPFYDAIYLTVNWFGNGYELKRYVEQTVGSASRKIQAPEFYFRPGITWPSRTQSGFAPRALPHGCVFDTKGNSAFIPGDDLEEILAFLSLFLSSTFRSLVNLQMSFGAFEVGVIQRTPIPPLDEQARESLSALARRGWLLKRSLDTRDETSFAFTLPALLQGEAEALCGRAVEWEARVRVVEGELADIRAEIDERCFDLYSIVESERRMIAGGINTAPSDTLDESAGDDAEVTSRDEVNAQEEVASDVSTLTAELVSWLVGAALGRFDVRLTGEALRCAPEQDPFGHLPAASRGMLLGPDALPAGSGQIVSEEWLRAQPASSPLPPEASVSNATIPDSEYPIQISWDGILVDDPGFNGGPMHRDDIVQRAREVLDVIWKERAYSIEQEACEILGISDLREYFRKPAGFFQDHLKRYSKSRRRAPIYWPLSTASGSYTIWIYYHRLTDQTLYKAVNLYVEPKIAEAERGVARLEEELKSASGRATARLTDRLSEARSFLAELRAFREELLRIAALPYRPNLNDGVIINAAPFHKLFRLRSWAMDTEECWKSLAKGDYDWAHLAYTIWPDRVREVCKRDRSIAIAHGLEALCETPAPGAKKKTSGRGKRKAAAAEEES